MANWEERANQVKAERDAKIPKELIVSKELLAKYPPGSNILPVFAECGILTKQDLEITDLSRDASALLEELASGRLSSVDVTRAFCKRAAVAHQFVNCLVDFFMEEALERAAEIDAEFKKTGKPSGPLHGLPISMKGHQYIKGKDSGGGASVLSKAGKIIAPKNSAFVQLLIDAGGLMYCKTAVPQAIMHLETHSFWGHCLNPYNTLCTSGGSSGGEAALIAAGGSPLGLGGDIGGSLRGPAALCNLATIRNTTFRPPRAGSYTPLLGAEAINASNGPMCRSLRDVELFMKVMLDAQPWLIEPSLVAIPWRDTKTLPPFKGKGEKLRVGILRDDGVVRPCGPIARAMETVVAKLKESSEVEVVDYQPYEHAKGGNLVHRLYFPDGGRSIRETAAESGEPVLPLTEWVLSQPGVKEYTMHEYWAVCLEREGYKTAFQQHWNDSNVDVVLTPAGPNVAPPLMTSRGADTNIWNLTDYPGVVFQTGLLSDSKLDAQYGKVTDFRNESEKAVHETYQQNKFDGLPIGLQVVGPRYDDEKVLLAAKIIEGAWKGH